MAVRFEIIGDDAHHALYQLRELVGLLEAAFEPRTGGELPAFEYRDAHPLEDRPPVTGTAEELPAEQPAEEEEQAEEAPAPVDPATLPQNDPGLAYDKARDMLMQAFQSGDEGKAQIRAVLKKFKANNFAEISRDRGHELLKAAQAVAKHLAQVL